jgi:DNA gyrase subunit A
MPVDRPEEDWDGLQIVFATSAGDVRRNALSDFTNVKRNGKIAMDLPEGVELVNARICGEDDDVMLVTDAGRAIRFPTTEVRVFKGRKSTGVRGIRLQSGHRVVSMSVIRHFEASPGERAAFLKRYRIDLGAEDDVTGADDVVSPENLNLSEDRYQEMLDANQLLLTITSRGMGKTTSSFDYRTAGRGGQGVTAMDLSEKRGKETGMLVASFPVTVEDQIMLATSTGQSIRVPVKGISFRSRGAGGVKVFNTAAGEEVVSVAWIAEASDEDATPVE